MSPPSSDNERQFQLLVDSIKDYAIFMLDPDGRVTSWNSGAQRIKVYRPDEIIGRDFTQFYTDEDRAAGLPAQLLARAAESGRVEAEGLRFRKDGSRFWASVILDRIDDEAGRHVGFAK
jgi:PAS domain S-box-containing protein